MKVNGTAVEINIETKIALIGLCVTSILAVIGLFLNFLALRQSNRIAVSNKLADASKILSDELVSVSRVKQLLENELKEALVYPESAERAEKIAALTDLIEKKKVRQKKIDNSQEEISKLFTSINKISPGQVDEVISISYSAQALARSSHDLIKELKNNNA